MKPKGFILEQRSAAPHLVFNGLGKIAARVSHWSRLWLGGWLTSGKRFTSLPNRFAVPL